MKHNYKILIVLVGLFLCAQYVGLYVVDQYMFKDLPYGIEKPEFEKETSFIPVFLILLAATAVLLVLARLNARFLWKFLFFFATVYLLSISLSVFVHQYLAAIVALIAGLYKVFKPNLIIHNLSELFIYGALGALFVPVFNVFSIGILLVAIMVYDAIAVWKTKHMVKLAKFQAKMDFFPGLLIPYGKNKTAVLGGGDMGFPILFTGVVMVQYGLLSLIVPLFAGAGLFLLLLYGKSKKFYPAMPFIGAGCFLGYFIVILLSNLV